MLRTGTRTTQASPMCDNCSASLVTARLLRPAFFAGYLVPTVPTIEPLHGKTDGGRRGRRSVVACGAETTGPMLLPLRLKKSTVLWASALAWDRGRPLAYGR